MQLWEFESECAALHRRLVEETELRRSSEKACESLRGDIETTRRATVNLQDRLEASRVAFNEESLCGHELTADLAKRDRTHAAELIAKAKELAECEAARSSELEKLEADCNEMRSQLSATHGQLNEVEAKLLEVEERNWQLAE